MTQTYTDDEVLAAVETAKAVALSARFPCKEGVSISNKVFDPIRWAANEYLKAKKLLEFYSQTDEDDGGQRALEFLNRTEQRP
jgi:hypothetical protein